MVIVVLKLALSPSAFPDPSASSPNARGSRSAALTTLDVVDDATSPRTPSLDFPVEDAVETADWAPVDAEEPARFRLEGMTGHLRRLNAALAQGRTTTSCSPWAQAECHRYALGVIS